MSFITDVYPLYETYFPQVTVLEDGTEVRLGKSDILQATVRWAIPKELRAALLKHLKSRGFEHEKDRLIRHLAQVPVPWNRSLHCRLIVELYEDADFAEVLVVPLVEIEGHMFCVPYDILPFLIDVAERKVYMCHNRRKVVKVQSNYRLILSYRNGKILPSTYPAKGMDGVLNILLEFTGLK